VAEREADALDGRLIKPIVNATAADTTMAAVRVSGRRGDDTLNLLVKGLRILRRVLVEPAAKPDAASLDAGVRVAIEVNEWLPHGQARHEVEIFTTLPEWEYANGLNN
jgi:hypothetical protein